MRKLNRPTAPACLSKYKYGQDLWSAVTPADKSEIWLKLDDMQNKRCAYCECTIKTSIDDSNSHIEHFRQRSRYGQGIFDWDNLFGSCNKLDSCGNHKDSLPTYDYLDLIKMDEDDPEDFLEFLPDGSVSPKQELQPADFNRATETIRIFNLNGSLRRIRESHIKGYEQSAEEFAELAAQYPEEEWLPLLQEELKHIQNLPFATAIKHLLLPA